MNHIYEDRAPREPGEIVGLNIPDGYICEDCKNFHRCRLMGTAISRDRQCDYIPNDFALYGQESKAERFNREDEERLKAKYAT